MNKNALFHDATMTYLQPTEPDCYDTVRIRLRGETGIVHRVQIVWDDKPIAMAPEFMKEGFTFFSCRLQVGCAPVRYYFQVETAEGNLLLDAFGISQTPQTDRMFYLRPGFQLPVWAKGAVMYQIFTDRFFNADSSNDVMDGEYHYISGLAKRITDWYAPPDATCDIRSFYGGDLQGVLEKLDYLQELGIEVIYFNPLFCSPSSHKYDTQDYDHIDPHFGRIVQDGGSLLEKEEQKNQEATCYMQRVTDIRNLEASDQLFQSLVEAAHARGMKVIIDGVFNHCGSFNKWLDREGIYKERLGYVPGAYWTKESPYSSFFSFRENDWPENGSYDGWWGFDTLPKLNYETSEQLQEYILSVAAKWVSAPYKADGWRLDVAADLGHTESFNHTFWKRFRKVVKEANPKALILAEHYGDAGNWLRGDEWDTVMNYDSFMEPVSYFLTGVEKHSDGFCPEKIGDGALFFAQMITAAKRNFTYPSLLCAMNELSNHDHSRFLTRTNQKVGRVEKLGVAAASEGIRKEVLRQAVMIQMTWPGAPTVYYGDEAGLTGFTDPDNRRTYPWGKEDRELLEYHKLMIRLHKQYAELKTGSCIDLLAQKGLIAYGRFNAAAASVVVVHVNAYTQTYEIPTKYLGIPEKSEIYQMVITTKTGYRTHRVPHPIKGGILTITMPAHSAVLLRFSYAAPVTSAQFWASNTVDFSEGVR